MKNGEFIRSGEIYISKSPADGWKAKPGNTPQKTWYHPSSEVIGEERNPAADKAPILSDSDMVRLFFDNEQVSRSVFRKRLERAKKHTLEIEKDGYVVVEKEVKDPKTGIQGWRILEPRKGQQPMIEAGR